MKSLKIAAALAVLVGLAPVGAGAQNSTQVGTLSCDVSSGLGLFVVQKQTLNCVFLPNGATTGEIYVGSLDQFGVELGGVEAGHLIWGVIAPTVGVQQGALAGRYDGVGANASIGVGAGANILVGGSDKAFSLQPLSVQGQIGINIAGGVTSVTLRTP